MDPKSIAISTALGYLYVADALEDPAMLRDLVRWAAQALERVVPAAPEPAEEA